MAKKTSQTRRPRVPKSPSTRAQTTTAPRAISAKLLRAARELDALTPEEIAAFKSAARTTATEPPRTRRGPVPRGGDRRVRAVAEGDSWFDFPLGTDILDCLANFYDYRIDRFAKRGDTLENMIFGSNPYEPSPLDGALRALREHDAPVFLFSGGGNDVAGPELETYLNHAHAGLELLRTDFARYVFDNVVRRAYETLIDRVQDERPGTHIVAHGYAEAIPSGRSVDILIFRVAGPWLKPAFDRKATPENVRRLILRSLIDMFNRTLADLAQTHEHFHYVDLRSDITDADWRDELHLRNSAYARVAARFDQKIKALELPA